MSLKSPEAFRTISEVSKDLSLPQHVLRFWETKFIQIKPIKRGGGRRYYRPEDVQLLKGIKSLLYNDGYTIRGVQKVIKENGTKPVVAFIAGDTAPKGRTMGHAGAIVGGESDTAAAKKQILKDCGVHVVDSPADLGTKMAELLGVATV